jgi:hypothetical protein
MRILSIIIASLALMGCAAQQPPVSAKEQLQQSTYAPSPAAALAFDPPVLAGQPQMDLSRDDRQPAAFAGYQDTVTTFSDTHTDDLLGDSPIDSSFQRDASSDRITTNYR